MPVLTIAGRTHYCALHMKSGTDHEKREGVLHAGGRMGICINPVFIRWQDRMQAQGYTKTSLIERGLRLVQKELEQSL